MASAVIDLRQQAHKLIDRMAASQVSAVVGLLETMHDPVAVSLANAPDEDEEISEEETLAVRASKEWLKHNKGIPNEEILSEFGLTIDDVNWTEPEIESLAELASGQPAQPAESLIRAMRNSRLGWSDLDPPFYYCVSNTNQ
ncbi:MAG: hypothetical protein ABSC48_06655 [Terracidiphilus sp.]|jgi:hypothetical protein